MFRARNQARKDSRSALPPGSTRHGSKPLGALKFTT